MVYPLPIPISCTLPRSQTVRALWQPGLAGREAAAVRSVHEARYCSSLIYS
jgi:hypothetical protein